MQKQLLGVLLSGMVVQPYKAELQKDLDSTICDFEVSKQQRYEKYDDARRCVESKPKNDPSSK